jgi:hypothetical protein
MKPFILVLALALLLMAPVNAIAGLVISTTNSSVAPGGSGSFDVLLTNTDTNVLNVQTVGGFSFQISVPVASGIQFTGVDFNTSLSYLFAGNSFDQTFGFPLSGDVFPNTTFTASDLADVGGFGLAGTQTVGLGHVTYQASNALSGNTTISFIPYPATGLTDDLGNNLAVDVHSGTIEAELAVPEPSTLVLMTMGGLCLFAWRRRRLATSTC